MEFEIDLAADGSHICVTINSVLTQELRRRYIEAALALARETGLNRFLIDARTAPSSTSVVDDYQAAYEITRQSGVRPGTRIAGLLAEGDSSRAFLETVANNAGFQVRMFTDKADALDWLSSSSEPAPLTNSWKIN